jgi:hypothetical protein
MGKTSMLEFEDLTERTKESVRQKQNLEFGEAADRNSS